MVRNQSFHMKKPIKCGLANHQSPSLWHQHPFYQLAKTAAGSALFTWLTGQDFMFEICSNRNLSSSGMKLLVVHGMGSICISQLWIFPKSRIRFPRSHQASKFVSQIFLSCHRCHKHLKEVNIYENINFAFPGLASRGSRPQPEQQCPPNTWLGDPGCLCKRD